MPLIEYCILSCVTIVLFCTVLLSFIKVFMHYILNLINKSNVNSFYYDDSRSKLLDISMPLIATFSHSTAEPYQVIQEWMTEYFMRKCSAA